MDSDLTDRHTRHMSAKWRHGEAPYPATPATHTIECGGMAGGEVDAQRDVAYGLLPQPSQTIPTPSGDQDGKPASGCPNGIKQQAGMIGEILSLPANETGESLLHVFCRIRNIPYPRRSRAIFDVLVKEGKAKNFPAAVMQVADWLRDWPGVGFDLGPVDSAEFGGPT